MVDIASQIGQVSTSLDDVVATPKKRVALGGIASLLALLSVLAMVIGVSTADAQKFVLAVGIGTLLGAAALLLVGKIIQAATASWSDVSVLTLGGSIVLVGLAITTVGVTALNSWPADLPMVPMIGLVVTIVGVLIVGRRVNLPIATQSARWLVGGIALTVLALLVLLTGPMSAPRWAVSVGAWIVGITIFKLALTPWMNAAGDNDAIESRALWVIRASGPALVVATLLMTFGDGGRVFVVAGWLVAFTLSAAGLAGLLLGNVWTKSIATAGLLLVGVGAFFLAILLPAWVLLALVVGAMAATIGGFFVLRGEGVVIVVLFGALLAWVLVDRTAEPAIVVDPIGTVVVLGDSFMAGQGGTQFLPGTNSKDDGANMCRRSPVSFAALIAQEFQRTMFDYACNGAETFQIAGTSRSDLAQLEDLQASDGKAQLFDAVTPPFAVDDLADVDLILVSAGGNDAEFSTVVTTCFLPSDCDDESRRFLTLAAASEGALVSTYNAIARTFPEGTPIVVIPYPSYIGAEACGNAIDEAEVAFANVFIATMNGTIRAATETASGNGLDIHYFDELDRAYAGRSLCDGERGANFVNLLPPEGPILERLTPKSWHEGSAHPNDLGHRCTAVVLADWLVSRGILEGAERAAKLPSCEIHDEALAEQRQRVDELIARTDADRGGAEWRTPLVADVRFEKSDPDNPDSDEVRVVCDAEPCFAVNVWAAGRASELVPALMWRLGLLLLGGLLVALAAARRWADVAWLNVLIPERMIPFPPASDE